MGIHKFLYTNGIVLLTIILIKKVDANPGLAISYELGAENI